MSVALKSAEDIAKMRVAGRLAGELLDYLTPHVQPGVTTGELDRIALDHQLNVQHVVPATLNYAPPGHRPYPASICTSVNHVVCHGVPGRQEIEAGRHPQHRRDGDQGWMARRLESDVLRRHSVDPGQASGRGHVRSDVARHPGRASRAPTWVTSAMRSRSSPRAIISRWSASSAATASDGNSTRNRRYCTTGGLAPG